MSEWWRGQRRGLLGFVGVVILVAGGLGWVTAAALRLEREQLDARARSEWDARVRLALWRLDSRISPLLTREDSRPYNHYSALFAPSLTLRNNGQCYPAGTVLELSPLLNADLPPWMLLHFQTGENVEWGSPQVPFPALARKLKQQPPIPCQNVTPARAALLQEFVFNLPGKRLLEALHQRDQTPTAQDTTLVLVPGNNLDFWTEAQNSAQELSNETRSRYSQQQKMQKETNPYQQYENREAADNNLRQGQDWFLPNYRQLPPRAEVPVRLSPMVPVWVTIHGDREQLLLVRSVQIEQRHICQGILLDEQQLARLLLGEIHDLFPVARLIPMRSEVAAFPELTMATLPFQLDPGESPQAPSGVGWTALRVGLVLAWLAAGIALLAVALGGYSLMDLSERRFRFVSAVTHELRTPLTTLRLYLDMLVTGIVSRPEQQTEYLHTLHQETERLTRLVNNVLAFARLEKQRPRLSLQPGKVITLIDQVRQTWESRCQEADKTLLVQTEVGAELEVRTDLEMVQQVLSNLLDNACKYSRAASDPRIWMRAFQEGNKLILEVEDCGPGVALSERRSIFRPFRRGGQADVTAGGVGLGLALARSWARLLGGELILTSGASQGACFRLELPLHRS